MKPFGGVHRDITRAARNTATFHTKPTRSAGLGYDMLHWVFHVWIQRKELHNTRAAALLPVPQQQYPGHADHEHLTRPQCSRFLPFILLRGTIVNRTKYCWKKIGKYIGFCVCRRSYLMWSPVISNKSKQKVRGPHTRRDNTVARNRTNTYI